MDYIFDEFLFKKTFKVDESKSSTERRLTHVQEMGFKLYPNKASTNVLPVTDMKEVIGGFFRYATNIEKKQIDYNSLCNFAFDHVSAIDDNDKEAIADVISGLFYKNGKFSTNNIGLYPYQIAENDKEADELAFFLYSVLANSEQITNIVKSSNICEFNVLENIVKEYIDSIPNNSHPEIEHYIPIYIGTSNLFLKDLQFMLSSDMNSIEDLSNLFSFYYFQYYVQTSLILDQFCVGDAQDNTELYYALDWERVSKNRKCCTNGWDKVKLNISHSFAHKTTLGILSNNKNQLKLNYLDFYELTKNDTEKDEQISKEIKKAEQTYTKYLGDYTGYSEIEEVSGRNKTETALMHLFNCVEQQFLGTKRDRARSSYNDKFIIFCKERWIKDRKKSGLVLNLTERDIIFLTKLAIGSNDKIRLNEMFIEYQNRGVFLDNTSKELLQEYFAKLNIIDKKSDSGDAQYVRRIL